MTVRRRALAPPDRMPRRQWEKSEYIEALAIRLGASPWVVRKWRTRGVSHKWRALLMEEAGLRGVKLYSTDFEPAAFLAPRPQWAMRHRGRNTKLHERLEESGWL